MGVNNEERLVNKPTTNKRPNPMILPLPALVVSGLVWE
ncbi:uncharacterized protein G2W53_043511 [Senna tora]|uniref:Uncharacterized protein n=1 Tax=Senna tora TaxID=362788 RepID=A0A834SH59_9FABA|nr:uncharacterized protein G2W53_043511 [Senna tora]